MVHSPSWENSFPAYREIRNILWNLKVNYCVHKQLGVFISPLFYSHGLTAPSGPGPPRCRGLTVTLRHATFGRTPLVEWLLPVNTQHSQQTSMPPAGFEPTIPASERPLRSTFSFLRQMKPVHVLSSTSCWSVLILSSHISLNLSSDFATVTLYALLCRLKSECGYISCFDLEFHRALLPTGKTPP